MSGSTPTLEISGEILSLLGTDGKKQVERGWQLAHEGSLEMICAVCRSPIPGGKPEPGAITLRLGETLTINFLHRRCGASGVVAPEGDAPVGLGSRTVPTGPAADVTYMEFRSMNNRVAGIMWKPNMTTIVAGGGGTFEELLWKGHGAVPFPSFQAVLDAPSSDVPLLAHTHVRLTGDALDVMFSRHTADFAGSPAQYEEGIRMTIGENPPFSEEWREVAGRAGEVRCVILSSEVELEGNAQALERTVTEDFDRGKALVGRAPFSVFQP